MKRVLFLTSALLSVGFAAAAQEEITVVSWGGAYGASQMEAYHKPYMALTGIKINSVDADNPATPIKAQVEAGNVSIDIADVEPSDLVRLCDEGALEVLPIDELPGGRRRHPRGRGLHRGRALRLRRRHHRLLDPHRLPHRQGRGPHLVRRLLRPREVPRQARPAQGREVLARAGADGRRRAAGRGLRGARHPRGRRPRLRQARHHQGRGDLVGGRRPAAAAPRRRRGGDDHRLQRPHLQRHDRGEPAVRARSGRTRSSTSTSS